MEKSAKSIPHSLVNLKSSTWFREHTPSVFLVYLAFNKYVLDTPFYREMYRILGGINEFESYEFDQLVGKRFHSFLRVDYLS